LPASEQSKIERRAELKLGAEGDLEGKLTVSFTGLEALWRRIDERTRMKPPERNFSKIKSRKTYLSAARWI